MEKSGQKFLYLRKLCKLSSTKFDLESNWNILNEKRRPEFPISGYHSHYQIVLKIISFIGNPHLRAIFKIEFSVFFPFPRIQFFPTLGNNKKITKSYIKKNYMEQNKNWYLIIKIQKTKLHEYIRSSCLHFYLLTTFFYIQKVLIWF